VEAVAAAEKRPQDLHGDGIGLTFTTLEHSSEYPDTIPQAIHMTDAEGRSCIYVPVRVLARTSRPDDSGRQPFVGHPAASRRLLLPRLVDHDPCAQDRKPIDVIFHGCSTKAFQA
jgi:hypothetical protein